MRTPNWYDRVIWLIGAFVLSCLFSGALNLIDFHVCIKGPGECKIISMDEYRALTEKQND